MIGFFIIEDNFVLKLIYQELDFKYQIRSKVIAR